MNLHITEPPLRKVLKTGHSTFKADDTVKTVLDRIAASGIDVTDRTLIIDNSNLLAAILTKDPVNQYYRGSIGDIYRITDVNSVRYRRVTKGDIPQTQNKINTAPAQDIPGSYYRAHITLLEMLSDRKCTLDGGDLSSLHRSIDEIKTAVAGDISTLDIRGLKDRRGRDMYVIFMSPSNPILTSRRRAGIVNGNPVLMNIIKTIAQENALDQFDIDDESSLSNYAKYADIIIVHNNPTNENVTIEKTHSGTFIQFFSVQQLAFNITKHRDQPLFVLLDPVADRQELRDIHSLNGVALDPAKTLADYKITSDTKLILT